MAEFKLEDQNEIGCYVGIRQFKSAVRIEIGRKFHDLLKYLDYFLMKILKNF